MTTRTLRTREPRHALAGLRAGKRVTLDVPRSQVEALRALFTEKLPAAVLARLRIRGSEEAERAGCLVLRTTRKGGRVGLYRSREAGMEADPAYPYSTVCEEHNTLVCHETRRLAEQCLSHPEMWCDDCRAASQTERTATDA